MEKLRKRFGKSPEKILNTAEKPRKRQETVHKRKHCQKRTQKQRIGHNQKEKMGHFKGFFGTNGT
jgi:hypothetical protein